MELGEQREQDRLKERSQLASMFSNNVLEQRHLEGQQDVGQAVVIAVVSPPTCGTNESFQSPPIPLQRTWWAPAHGRVRLVFHHRVACTSPPFQCIDNACEDVRKSRRVSVLSVNGPVKRIGQFAVEQTTAVRTKKGKTLNSYALSRAKKKSLLPLHSSLRNDK